MKFTTQVFSSADESLKGETRLLLLGVALNWFVSDIGSDRIIECNMKIVNYLDVTFNLNESTY